MLHQTDEISNCISSINAIGDLCLKFILQANLCSMSRPPVCYWFLSCLRGKRNMMLLFEDLIFCQKWREYMYLNCAAFFHCWTNKSIKIMLNYKKRRKENVLGVRMQVGVTVWHCFHILEWRRREILDSVLVADAPSWMFLAQALNNWWRV